LLLAEIVSTVGTTLTMVALPWFVLTTSGSPARAALVMAAEVAPVALFGVLSGSWAERMGARRWMLLSDGCRAPLVALIPTLSALGMLPFWMLLLAVFALGSFTAPYFASQQVLLAEVVGEDQAALSQATSVLQSATRLTLLIGPPAAGLLIAALGAPAVLYLDAASYLAAVALIATKTPTSGITANAVSTGVLAGLKTLYADRLLGMWTTASLLSEAAYQALFIAIPVLVITRYHASATLAGLLLGAFGAGAAGGSLLAAYLARSQPAQRLAIIGKSSQVPVFLLLILPLSPLGFGAVMLSLGVFNGIANGPSFAVRLARIPVQMRAKTLTAATTITMLGATIGLVLAGIALQALTARTVFVAMGVLQLASVGLFTAGYINPPNSNADNRQVAANRL